MLTFSSDPQVAEKQMRAVIFYLTTFGYVDGEFDKSEQVVVADYIRQLIIHRVETGMPNATPEAKAQVIATDTSHFFEVFQGMNNRIVDYYTEAVANGEDQASFVRSKLKLHCFEIFNSFDLEGQKALMAIVDRLLMADGVAHPAEVEFRAELSKVLQENLEVQLLETATPRLTEILPEATVYPDHDMHPFFDQFEHHYSSDKERLAEQIEGDEALIEKALASFAFKRQAGRGQLAGHQHVSEFSGAPFLDGHIYVIPTSPEGRYDITVLGDLHGCYSCLKAALLQSNFLEKVEAYRRDPTRHPDPKLILLGDYIDRGKFSLNGVLRTVISLSSIAPDHVFMLRGNHEFYVEHEGDVVGGVYPAEAIDTMKPHAPLSFFQHYIRFFENMPAMVLFGKMLLVHGGIPKERTLKKIYRDLASLNDPTIRFEMMWSDPSTSDVVPAMLQEESVRFSYGRLQAAAFLQRIGCHTMIRGHEKINSGYEINFNDDHLLLATLFSAGGEHNLDLPEYSGYRSVSPVALSMEINGDNVRITPWRIDYKRYNKAKRNSFFKTEPEIKHKVWKR